MTDEELTALEALADVATQEHGKALYGARIRFHAAANPATILSLIAEVRRHRWQGMESAPRNGRFMVANYAPTSWEYWPTAVAMHPELPDRHRELQLKYARAWMPLPPAPEQEGER